MCSFAHCNAVDIAWECLPSANGTACNDGNACTANDRCDGQGNCAGTLSCVPGTPGPISAASNNGTGAFTVSWGASSGVATRYDLFENGTAIIGTASLSANITGKVAGTYTYSVRCCNLPGCSAQTAGFTVTVTTPGVPGGVSGPSTNSSGAYSLSWGASSGSVDHYELWENGAGILSTASLNANISAKVAGGYAYTVRGCGPTGCGSFTAGFSVTVTPPGQPGAMSGPAGNSSANGSYSLNWGAASGSVASYQLYEGGSPSQVNLTSTTASVSGKGDGTYHYTVRACGPTGCGAFTADYAVTVLFPPGVPGSISAPSGDSPPFYTVSWGASSGSVARYDLDELYSPAGLNFTTTTSGVTGPVQSFSSKPYGVYAYRVRACNASGCSAYGSTSGVFNVVTPLLSFPDSAVGGQAVPAQGWIGTVPGEAGVEGGAATYHIPIEVPPGRAGMQPAVALTYSSRSGNGVAGVGWSVSTGKTIYRCPRTVAQDWGSTNGGGRSVRHDMLDKLCYDGQRLVGPTDANYGQQNTEYRTEIDQFASITLKNGPTSAWTAYFEVAHKSGRRSQYEPGPQLDNSPTAMPPDTWYLAREFDPQGNCIEYNYSIFASRGIDQDHELTSISYTGTPDAGSGRLCRTDSSSRSVEFSYTSDRPDKRTTNRYGLGSMMTARLAAISTKVGAAYVRRYELAYSTSPATNRSTLSSVQLCAGNSCAGVEKFPTTTFNYQADLTTFDAWHAKRDGVTLGPEWRIPIVGDLDGDGTRDTLFASDTGERDLRLSSCTTVAQQIASNSFPVGYYTLPDATPLGAMVDFNNDGRVDIVGVLSGTLLTETASCSGWARAIVTNLWVANLFPATSSQSCTGIDYDGDGIVDVRCFGVLTHPGYQDDETLKEAIVLRRSRDATDWSNGVIIQPPVAPANLVAQMTRDINGDGSVDTVFDADPAATASDPTRIGYYYIDQLGSAVYTYPLLTDLGGPSGSFKQAKNRRWIDVNGDGLPDIYDPPYSVYINRGGPFLVNGAPNAAMFQRVNLATPAFLDLRAKQAFVMDIDNDGRDEIVVPNYRVHDYCYSDPTHKQPSGEAIYFCGADFDNAPPAYVNQDRSVFSWDAYRFVEGADGSYTLSMVGAAGSGSLLAPVNYPLNQNDSNGDGTTDIYYRLQNSTVASVSKYYDPSTVPSSALGPYIARNSAKAPDVLISATNGLNATSNWKHRPLSDTSAQTDGSVGCDMTAGPFYHVDLDTSRSPGYSFFASSMWVVARLDQSNGVNGGMNKTCFRYQNAMLNNEGRGLQGFKTIIAEQQSGKANGENVSNDLRTTTQFYQEFPLTSRLSSVTVERPAVEAPAVTGLLLHSTTYWWNVAPGVGGFGQTVVTPAGALEMNYDTDRNLASQRTTVTESDLVSGEPKRVCSILAAATPDPASTSAKDVIGLETFDLTNDVAPGVWWLAKVNTHLSQSDFLSSPFSLPPCNVSDSRANATACATTAPACPSILSNSTTAKGTLSTFTWSGASPTLQGTSRKLAWRSLGAASGGIESSVSYDSYDQFGNLLVKHTSARDIGASLSWPSTNAISDVPAVVATYTADGYFPATEKDALQHASTKTFDAATGQALTTQAVQSAPVTHYTYDSLGRLVSQQTDGGQAATLRVTACQSVPGCSFKVQTFQAGAPVETSYHDLLGRAMASGTQWLATDPTEIISVVTYNERGFKLAEYAPTVGILGPGSWNGNPPATGFGTFFSAIDALGRPGLKTVMRDGSSFASGQGSASLTTTYAHSAPSGFSKTVITVSNPGPQGLLTMSRTYDRLGKLVQTTQTLSATAPALITSYFYDPAGSLTLIRDSAGNLTSAAYDALSRKTSVNDPDRGVWAFSWDGLGRLRTQTDAKNTLLVFQYDYDGRLEHRLVKAQTDAAVKTDATWQYDLNGKPGTVGSMQGPFVDGPTNSKQFIRNYSYDQYLRPWRVTTHIPDEAGWGQKDYAVEYGYDRNYGRVKAILFPSNEIASVDYDANGNRVGETQLSVTGTRSNVAYRQVTALSERGQVTQQSLGQFMTEVNTYDVSTGMPLSMNAHGMKDAQPAGCTSLLMARQVDYKYDQFLNLAEQDKQLLLRAPINGALQFNACTPKGAVSTETYQYDQLQRLTSASRAWSGLTAAAATTTADSYTYDDLGNIVSKSDYGDQYIYGTVARSGPNMAGPHAVATVMKNGFAKAPFVYDANGSMTSGDGRSIHYDNLDHPDQVVLGSTTTTFRYAPDGSRYVQSSWDSVALATTNEYYVDKMFEHLEQIGGSAGPEDRTYVSAAVQIRMKNNIRSVRYLHLDRLGSLDSVTTDTGVEDPTDAHGYDAFGKPRPRDWQTTADSTSWQMQQGSGNYGLERGFTGHEHLDSLFLIHMNGRMYDYRLGRFLSVDPIISNPANSQSLNPYSYIGNNPLSGTDPTGYAPEGTGSGCGTDGKFSQCTSVVVNGPLESAKATNARFDAGINGAKGAVQSVNSGKPADQAGAPAPSAAAPKEEASQERGVLLAQNGPPRGRGRAGGPRAAELPPESIEEVIAEGNVRIAKERIIRAGGNIPEELRAPGPKTEEDVRTWERRAEAAEAEQAAKAARSASGGSVADKLQRYLLNPEHVRGKFKAEFFEQSLGYTRENAGELAKQLIFRESEAVQKEVTPHGTKFEQTINVTGANGRVIPLTTGWIRGADGVVRLTTAYPEK